MDDKIISEMQKTLAEIKASLGGISLGHFRGPIADPAPGWGHFPHGPIIDWGHLIRGPVGDPAPDVLLGKDKLAQLKVHRLETTIKDLQQQIDTLKLERDLLKEEYKLK